MNRLLSWVTRSWHPWLVIAVWVALAGGLYLLGPKLSDRTSTSNQDLPAGAEAQRASRLMDRAFPGPQGTPLTLAFGSGSALTDAQKQAVRDVAGWLGATSSLRLAGEPRVRMAPDGRGALIEVSLRGDPAQAGYRDRLAAIRDHVGTSLQGMEVHVTGVGALAAATFNAFSNIDLTLLLGSVVIVLVLLLVVYRAVLLPLISLLNIGVAYVVAIGLLGVGYTVVDATASQIAVSLLIVLLFGAGTDYALLLISRYREGLHEGDEPREALTDSLLASWEAITASGSTVALAMLAFLAALLPVFRSFGPIIATGIVVTFIAGLTLLPAMMAVLGRAAFWPRVPKAGSPSSHKVWSWVAGKVTARPALSALAVTGALGALCLGLLLYTPVFNLVESFRSPNEATRGYHLLERHFPPGEVAPTTVVAQFPDGVTKARTGGILAVLQGDPLVQTAAPGPVSASGDTQLFTAVLSRDPYSSAAISHMSELRAKLHNVVGPGATVLLAGPTMLSADLRATSLRDSLVVGAIALAVVGVVLGLLLRSLVAPLLLLGANLLSFFAALGLTVTVSYLLFGGRGFSFEVPLYMFIFLIALGSDYNIFITTRIRQEALQAWDARRYRGGRRHHGRRPDERRHRARRDVHHPRHGAASLPDRGRYGRGARGPARHVPGAHPARARDVRRDRAGRGLAVAALAGRGGRGAGRVTARGGSAAGPASSGRTMRARTSARAAANSGAARRSAGKRAAPTARAAAPG